MLSMSRNELIERLKRLDEDASLVYGEGKRFHLVIVGGGALILQEYISRATHDIDAIAASKELHELMGKYDINGLVQTYINNFPYNYEDRLVPLLAGEVVDFFVASLEDIVIAKLYSYRDTDLHDIKHPDVLKAMDWSLLEHLATDEREAHASALNENNYAQFRYSYEKYVEEHRP